ncbi:MAG TPA: hypothetical protein VK508_15615 [Cyclobacteriaceae bacterium]|nr:hypothetical protein [Cyclobacteriaceae bacterium]
MNLSPRAAQYLSTLSRNDGWVSNEDETRAYLVNQKIFPFEQFLKYQLWYSGYDLAIKNDPQNSFSCRLFSGDQIRRNKDLTMERASDRLVEVCGTHKTAQFTFFLTDKGELCTLDDENLPIIQYGTFEKCIEEYALRNEIYFWDQNPYYFNVLRPHDLVVIMDQKCKIVPECSDPYVTWWAGENLVAVKGVWLDRQEFYFHVYGTRKQICDELITDLINQGILK